MGAVGRPGLWLVALWAATAALWLASALRGGGLEGGALWTARAVAALALAAAAAAAARAAARTWSRAAGGRLLLALLALSALLYLSGLGHELTGRYFGDEGIYLAQAHRIDDSGQLVRPWFIYPHLLFYLDAMALWLASLFAPAVAAAGSWLYGAAGPGAVEAVVTRAVTALLGALTVVPVFRAARRLGGVPAAGIAGALAVLSPIYLRVLHLNISDGVGAFFAAMTFMQCAELVATESIGGYLLAGLWAGLAAGGKYPAGLVAVAIPAVWLRWRLAGRAGAEAETAGPAARGRWGLALAAAVAIAAFLATTPSMLALPGAVFGKTGGKDVLFGLRQYGLRGWTGVVRSSNWGFYARQLLRDLGAPVLLAALAGAWGLTRRERRRLAWLLPFPAVYLALLLVLRIAIPRNLLPVLPALAVLAGVGAAGALAGALAGAGRWLRSRPGVARSPRLRAPLVGKAAGAAAVLVLLAVPAAHSAAEMVRLWRPSTRDLAAAWVVENLPPGSFLVQEVYTPWIEPSNLYPAIHHRFAVRMSPERLRDPAHDYLVLASAAYGRFFTPGWESDPRRAWAVRRYREIFDTFEAVRVVPAERFRDGPEIRIYQIDSADPAYTDRLERSAARALVSSPAMRPEGSEAVSFLAPGQWALVKGYLEPGTYRVEVDEEPAGAAGETGETGETGRLRVLTRRGREVGSAALTPGGGEIVLPARDKYFLYVSLPAGSRLRGVRARRLPGVSGGPQAPVPGDQRSLDRF